jgi:hypothetical protein
MYFGRYDNAKATGYGLLKFKMEEGNMYYYGEFKDNERSKGTSIYPDGSFYSGDYTTVGGKN